MKKLIEKIKDTLNIFYSNKGFTLLELLVVVLIIGILAAIALPQYKMAVGKAKFSTLKNITRSIAESAQRYYLTQGVFPKKTEDLDIDLNVVSEGSTSYLLHFSLSSGEYCEIYDENSQKYVTCRTSIFNKRIMLYIDKFTMKPILCYVIDSLDVTDNANRLCQKETNRKEEEARCKDGSCYYSYR